MVFPKLKGTEIQDFNSHKQKSSVNIFILLSGNFHAVENWTRPYKHEYTENSVYNKV